MPSRGDMGPGGEVSVDTHVVGRRDVGLAMVETLNATAGRETGVRVLYCWGIALGSVVLNRGRGLTRLSG